MCSTAMTTHVEKAMGCMTILRFSGVNAISKAMFVKDLLRYASNTSLISAKYNWYTTRKIVNHWMKYSAIS